MILPHFNYHGPTTLDEALVLLSDLGQDARILAGGTDLLPKMKLRRLTPGVLVDLKRIPSLAGVSCHEDGVRLGALTTIQSFKDLPIVNQKLGILAEAAGLVATTQIRNVGTIGGNLCNASPASDLAPALMVLDARVRLASKRGERIVDLNNFFVGPGKTVLAPDEVLVEVQVPYSPGGSAGIYLKHSLRRADIAIASVAVLLATDGDIVSEARIALGAVAATPVRATRTESFVTGRKVSEGLLEEAAVLAVQEAHPIDDLRARADYRRHMVQVLTKEAIRQAYEQALRKGGMTGCNRLA